MLKKDYKKYIMVLKIFLILFFCLCFSFARAIENSEDEFVIKPSYIFKNKGNRDPFKPRYKANILPVVENISISTLVLQGITETQETKAALFKSSSENTSYILMDGKLYRENEEVVPDIFGEIISEKEVVLRQGDKEIIFKLSDDVTGPNISPGF
jgi:hypothetical protein